jgi:ribosomal protein L27
LFAKIDGKLEFRTKAKGRVFVSVLSTEAMALPMEAAAE